MTRKIQSIKVQNSKTIYVNFDNGTFGTRSFFNEKWNSNGLTTEELTAAKELAYNGKWTNYSAPRKVTVSTNTRETRCPSCGGNCTGLNCNSNRF